MMFDVFKMFLIFVSYLPTCRPDDAKASSYYFMFGLSDRFIGLFANLPRLELIPQLAAICCA
jgi:hypothetical protein